MGVGTCAGVSLTCHIPNYPLRLPSRTTSTCLCTVIVVSVNVAVQPSSHSCPMEISAPDWMWVNMWAILDLVGIKGIRCSYALWVACMMLPSGSITRGTCCVLNLFTQGVSSLI